MQGQRSANTPLPELSSLHSFASSESSMDQQSFWNHVLNPSQGQPSDYVGSSSNGSTAYLNSSRQEGHPLSGWHYGGSSSSGAYDDVTNQNNLMNNCSRAALVLGERQYEFSGNLSLSSLNGNIHTDQDASGSLLMRSPSVSIDEENSDDDCQVIECVNAFRFGSSNERLAGGSSSQTHNFAGMPSENGIYSEEGGRRLSCKRKMAEPSSGESSGSGSSNYFQNFDINSERSPPRLGLSLGESGNDERSRENFRLRINTSQQQDGSSSNVLSAQRSMLLPPVSNSFDLGPSSLGRNSQSRWAKASISRATNFSSALSGEEVPFQSVSSLHQSSQIRPTKSSISRAVNPSSSLSGEGVPSQNVSSLLPSSQTRWTRSSISRAANPSSAIPGVGVSFQSEGPDVRSVPGIISPHPMFMQANEIGSSSQNPRNWSLAKNVASSSHGGVGSGFNSPAPSLVPHYNHHPSGLPEYAPRSSITPPGIGTANQNTAGNLIHSGAQSLPERGFPQTPGHRFHTRSSILLERQLGTTVGIPYPSRGLSAASQGRIRLVSEIRNVLDRMRRAEAMRVEDLIILEQSGFLGMAEVHDRHRDMRLDVDNMSYEELLALEERIGNVCTGLSEETISSRLKRRKYVHVNTELEEEPCCICQDEYNHAQDLGVLDCGHEFHTDCVKQWLMQKNICPICKTTGLN